MSGSYNKDLWIGMITAGPVLLVAFGTVFQAGRDAIVDWFERARWLWLAVLRGWVGGVVLILGGLGGPAALTVYAGYSLYRTRDVLAPAEAVDLLFVSVASLVVVVIGITGSPHPTPIPPADRPKWHSGVEVVQSEPAMPATDDDVLSHAAPSTIAAETKGVRPPIIDRKDIMVLGALGLAGYFYRRGLTGRAHCRASCEEATNLCRFS